MARAFDVATEAPRFSLPLHTREQIAALMRDLDQDARSVIIIAVAQLWDREIGPASERDVYAELDELKAAIAVLSAA